VRGLRALPHSGKPRLCRPSKGILGTYSEQLRVFAKSLVVLPDSIVPGSSVARSARREGSYGAVKKLNQFSLELDAGAYTGRAVITDLSK